MVKKNQVNALLRKSLAYQKKNVCGNIFVLLSPVIIAILLGIIQRLLDNLISEDAKCGCRCNSCTYIPEGSTESVSSTDIEVCNNVAFEVDCLVRDDDVCGPEFSDFEEILFCPIASPSLFPPMYELQNALPIQASYEPDDYDQPLFGGNESLPPEAEREMDFLFTSAGSFGAEVMAGFVRQPDIAGITSDPGILEQFTELVDGNLFGTTFDFSFLSKSSWDLGTRSELESLFLDQGLLNEPVTVTSNCSALLQAAASIGVDLDDLGPLGQWFQSCVDAKVLQVDSAAVIDEELFCTWPRADSECGVEEDTGVRRGYPNAFDWKATAPGSLDLDVWHNDFTLIEGQSIGALKRIALPITRAVNEWLEQWLGEGFGARMLAQMEMPKPGTKLPLDFTSFIGSLFYTWLLQLPMPWAVAQLVYEKENRLRAMMRMHGLANGVYMVVMYLYFILQYIAYAIIMLVSGWAMGLEFFRRNTVGVQIVFYFLYGNVQVALSFLLSCFFKKVRTANVSIKIWVLGSGLVAANLLDNIFVENRWFSVLLELIPTFGLYRGLWEMGQYSFRATYQNEVGMRFSQISEGGNGMGRVWIIFIIEWPIFMFLAWYLEQVLDSGIGIRKHWLFPFHRTKKDQVAPRGTQEALLVSQLPEDVGVLGDDVVAERNAAYSLEPSPEVPIVVRDMRKVFPPQDGNPEKVAVKNMSLKVGKGECFGLLGPNGAGKSTAINQMIGYLEPTSGEIFINGLEIKEHLNDIYGVMGVCPQHDLLWETLTAREHLNFYARLKGVPKSALKGAVDDALRSVKLLDVGNKPAGKYSGGMKRRLSVAISLIGSPAVAYLDEPSTGLDPASRRQLWDVVQNAKQNKAVILTTHSMEEAEGLCDRLAIFIDGRLTCIGNPKHLTARYGGYYVFTITTPVEQQPLSQAFVRDLSPNAVCTYALGGTSKFEIPTSDISLSAIFERMGAAAQSNLTMLDWGVHSASLEDVFISLAQKKAADEKTAAQSSEGASAV